MVCFVQELAYQYAKRGAVLVLVSPHEGKLQALAEGCKKRGAMDVRVICADVSKEDDCKRFIEETVNHYGTCMFLSRVYIFLRNLKNLVTYSETN